MENFVNVGNENNEVDAPKVELLVERMMTRTIRFGLKTASPTRGRGTMAHVADPPPLQPDSKVEQAALLAPAAVLKDALEVQELILRRVLEEKELILKTKREQLDGWNGPRSKLLLTSFNPQASFFLCLPSQQHASLPPQSNASSLVTQIW